ncbi:MAG: hypothetical protein MR314_01015 [Ezakiella sp.]|nr:hypothetical protein [Ezakiella sp.]
MSKIDGNALEGIDYSLFSLRATMNDLKNVHIYTANSSFVVDSSISFDSEAENISAINYFMGSLLSSIMLMSVKKAKKRDVIIEEIEGKIEFKLNNPLNALDVRGYYENSYIDYIDIKIYYYADGDEESNNLLLTQLLDENPIYNLIKKTTSLMVNFDLVI